MGDAKLSGGEGEEYGEDGGKNSVGISGGKLVLVLMMYWPRALRRGDSVQIVLSASMLSTSCSRTFQAGKRGAGQ